MHVPRFPVILFLLVGFAAPLLAVIWFSFMPPRSFSFGGVPTLENYRTIFESTTYISFLWSLGLAVITVVLLALICYPVAYGHGAGVRQMGHAGHAALHHSALRLREHPALWLGAVLHQERRAARHAEELVRRASSRACCSTLPAIIFGMVYVYLPFMLFPMTLGISMVPNETRDAAFDLGASRWQVFKEVELPLSMPGIVIGFLLTFVLAIGAIAEAKVLGGQRVIPITHDIEIAFTYSQNWPLGAAWRCC